VGSEKGTTGMVKEKLINLYSNSQRTLSAKGWSPKRRRDGHEKKSSPVKQQVGFKRP